MDLSSIRVIWLTELKNHLRDTRALMALLFISLMGPVGIAVAIFVIDDLAGEDEPMKIEVIGAIHAPGLITLLEQQDDIALVQREPSADMPAMGDAEAVLVIPTDYAERYLANIPARVTIYKDDSDQRSTLVARNLQQILMQHSQRVASQRLLTRGVPTQTLSPINVDMANVAPKDSQSLQFANLILYFLLFVPFLAGISIAIDSTAGERERGSLLPLMAQPISTGTLILGKFLSIVTFTLAALVIATLATFNMLHLVPTETLALNISLDWLTQLQMLIILLPLALLAVPLQIFFALSSKSYKEANSYLQILAIFPMALVMYGTLIASKTTGIEAYIPVIAQTDMMRDVVANGAVDWGKWLLNTGIALALASVALFGAINKLRDENILRVA